MDNSILLQKQIRDNNEDLHNFMSDLKHWEKEMKRKDEVLKAESSDQVSIGYRVLYCFVQLTINKGTVLDVELTVRQISLFLRKCFGCNCTSLIKIEYKF